MSRYHLLQNSTALKPNQKYEYITVQKFVQLLYNYVILFLVTEVLQFYFWLQSFNDFELSNS